MSKSTRNIIIIVAVVVVAIAAAVPFVIRAVKNKTPDEEVIASVTETEFATEGEVFTYPEESSTEEVTGAILSELLTAVEGASEESTTAPSQSTTLPTEKTTNKVASSTTTKKNPSSVTTTKKNSSTTTTAASGESVDDLNVEQMTGQEALSSSGVLSYMWDPSQNFYYVEDNPWQRNFGFNLLYDWAAPITVMFYDTFRAKFAYNDLEWMIQAWKGQYGYIFVGCEIGVYTRTPGTSGTHYDCADDNHLIYMEMSLYQNFDDGNGYKKLFTRTYYPHWWSTGFVDGHLTNYKFNDRSCLCLKARLTMYDQEMLNGFTAGLKECGFVQAASQDQLSPYNSDAFYVSGNNVYICWRTIDQGYSSR